MLISRACADDGTRDEMVAQKPQRLQQDYPATKVLFLPSTATSHRDLVAASSDSLRLWHLANDAAKFEKLLDVRSHPAVHALGTELTPGECSCGMPMTRSLHTEYELFALSGHQLCITMRQVLTVSSTLLAGTLKCSV